MVMRRRAGWGIVALLLAVLACAPAASAPPAPAAAGGAAASQPAAADRAAASQPAASAGATTVAAPSATPALESLRFAYPATSMVYLPEKLAIEQGIYRQHGIDLEMVLMGAGVMAAAQLAGEVDYSNSYPASIHLAAQGAPFRIVTTAVGAPLFALMARPDVQSVADLRGKPVGITTRGGAVDKVTQDLLAQAGLDADSDVTIVPAGAQVTVLMESLLGGRVQAAALSPPWFIRARDQGMRLLVKGSEALHEPQNGLAVTVDRLTQQHDQVLRMVESEIEAIRFMRDNRAATVALLRDWLSISQAEAEESYDFALPAFVPDARVDVAGLIRYADLEKASGNLPADFQIESMLDTTVVEEALRALDARR